MKEGGGGGGRKTKKKEARDDATRINRVTVWMQHTSLPLTNKAVKRENVVSNLGGHYHKRLTGPVYSMSECVGTRLTIALVLPEGEDHTQDHEIEPKSKPGLS